LPNSNGYRGSGVDVSYGCSDITEVVSWLLNEDTEAADVMALTHFQCIINLNYKFPSYLADNCLNPTSWLLYSNKGYSVQL